jgi:hypothetical protein
MSPEQRGKVPNEPVQIVLRATTAASGMLTRAFADLIATNTWRRQTRHG